MKTDESASFKRSTLLDWIEIRVANSSLACYEAHSHDEFSFGLITQGGAKYCNGRYKHQIGQGDIVTINPADVHSCNPNNGTWSYSMLFADTVKLGLIQQEVTQNTSMDYFPFSKQLERNPLLKRKYRQLYSTLQEDGNQLHSEQAVFEFIEASMDGKRPDNKVNAPPCASLQRIREKLFDQIDIVHHLEDLANEVEMSRYQLLRAFKSQYGLPPHAYLMDEKIKRAKNLLKEGLAISEVAHQLGFSDQAHFQRQFKKKLAVTPKYYQSHFLID